MYALSRKQVILIVDDQRLNLRILAGALGSDYEILTATEGETALALARADPQPDLIMLDVQMPGLSGYDVCRELKSAPATQSIPVMFVTAQGEVDDETHGFELGAVDYIHKPFKVPVVSARVRTHLRLRRQTELLERLAAIDGLTEIPNRRRLDEVLVAEWLRCQRDALPLTVALMDIDHFKRFNDAYGHPAGDDCLRRVAQALAGVIRRSGDLVARYGGEEFAAILPNTSPDGARQVAEAFRAAVQALGILHEHATQAGVVTISLGAVTVVPDYEGITATDLTRGADECLYAAKAQGRNRAVHSTLEPAGS
jgi:diguanylate cyclase (GGDEF)-like protein